MSDTIKDYDKIGGWLIVVVIGLFGTVLRMVAMPAKP